MNIVDSFESIYAIMTGCIEKEMVQDGILSDVETFIPIFHNESTVEEPVIWMTQHPTHAEKQADISRQVELITPFEFDCAVYKSELEEAELASQNLATRVILAITKNFTCVQKEVVGRRIIKKIGLETYYPVGTVEIKGKSDRVPATGVVLNVIHVVNWVVCCKQLENTNNDNNDDDNQGELNG
jgi:hypothetical protein